MVTLACRSRYNEGTTWDDFLIALPEQEQLAKHTKEARAWALLAVVDPGAGLRSSLREKILKKA